MKALPSETCRRCSECVGEHHHWLVICAEVDDDLITFRCKHCDATTEGVDCEACGDIVPAAASHLCEEDATWLCGPCLDEINKES